MTQRSHVPKFGNWESEDNVPYTVYFDKARKGKTGGKMINPNDPQDNPDEFPDDTPPVRAPPLITGTELELPVGQETARPRHERASSREDGDLRRLTDSPVRHDNVGRRGRGVNSGEAPKRGGRLSGGSDRSIEHSPLHPQHQARAGGRGTVISSPSWEKKSSEGSHTPGRSRLRTVGRGDESPEKGAAVPKFGDWDESNPASADGYTHIFNKVREEKQSGANILSMPTDTPFSNGQRRGNVNNKSTKCWCFG